MATPVPTPPVWNGDPGSGVSVPSAWRSNAAIVLVTAVLSFTYTCPTTFDADALADVAATPVMANASRHAYSDLRVSKRIASPLLAGVAVSPRRLVRDD